jgi:hypothetical protein
MTEFHTVKDLSSSACDLGYNASVRRVRSLMKIPYQYLASYRYLTLGLVLFVAGSTVGQEPPKAVLLDEFARLSCCCDLSGRIDMLLSELGANPGSIGYIVIPEPLNESQTWRERFLDGYIRYRGFDESRVILVRKSGLVDPLHTQLWVVPPGASMEGNFVENDKYVLPLGKRKFRFYDGTFDDPLCYTTPPLRLTAKYLRAAVDLTANIAIGAPTSKLAEEEKRKIIDRFKTEYDVDPTRLRFFRIRGKFYDVVHEIWLVRRQELGIPASN